MNDDKIVQIREALYDFMPNMWGFSIIEYKWDGKTSHGIFQVNLMSGHNKRIEVKAEGDKLEIKELSSKGGGQKFRNYKR